ncbi:hypothetical protein [Endozoicomonas sp.]|uniref:hypothetical protein n=1 Tax=Endozoicomonas sp. TaxID=1892382 RepID=UPI00383B2BD6
MQTATTDNNRSIFRKDQELRATRRPETDSMKISGTFHYTSTTTNNCPRREVASGRPESSSNPILETSLFCRQLLKIQAPSALAIITDITEITEIKKDIYLQQILNTATSVTKDVSTKITISSTGLKETNLSIHPDRLTAYKKTPYVKAEELYKKLLGPGLIDFQASPSALESESGPEKEQRLKTWAFVENELRQHGRKTLDECLKESVELKMGNCEIQAHLSVNKFNKKLEHHKIPVFKVEASICKNLFLKVEHVVGLISVYSIADNQLVARFVMDPWAGYCTAIEEIEQLHTKVKLNPEYSIEKAPL